MDAGIAAIDLDLAAVPEATISVETDRSNGSPCRGCRVRGRSRPVIHSGWPIPPPYVDATRVPGAGCDRTVGRGGARASLAGA
jgi:hypothetical protein